MTPHYSKIHNRFSWESYHLNSKGLVDLGYSFIKEGGPHEKSIGEFLLNWLDERDFVLTSSSGSTGGPKLMPLSKQSMVNSAIATGDALNLEAGQTCLLCLPATHIAGKMMLVRAMILGLELHYVSPSKSPLRLTKKSFDFCAMTPMQLKNSMHRIDSIGKILVGGGVVSSTIKEALPNKTVQVFETFGMTETFSHVALKKLHTNSGAALGFTPLPGISVSKDDRGCLIIQAPHILEGVLVTNDLVEIHTDGSFSWLGRLDNVINSGGVKLYPEKIEKSLSSYIELPYFIAALPNQELGECVGLLIEGPHQELDPKTFDLLDRFEKPKGVYFIEKFSYTSNGKVQRKETVAQLLKALKK